MSFVEVFGLPGDDGEPGEERERPRPPWLGPGDDELGVAVPLGLVLARSERGVVAASHALAHGSGLSLALVAQARGLGRDEATLLFHVQHLRAPAAPDELPDGFLRLGVELADGTRATNLAGRHPLLRHDREAEPEGPVFLQHGGGGGSAEAGRVVMRMDYWLWPLPPPGPIRLSCEWPVAGIPLSTAELDGAALAAAAEGAVRLWPGP